MDESYAFCLERNSFLVEKIMQKGLKVRPGQSGNNDASFKNFLVRIYILCVTLLVKKRPYSSKQFNSILEHVFIMFAYCDMLE